MISQLVYQRRNKVEVSNSVRTSASVSVAGDSGVSSVAFGTDEVADVKSGACVPVMYQDALLANEGGFGSGPAQADTVADRLDLQLATRGEVELFPERFGHDKTPGVVEGNHHAEMVLGVVDRCQRTSRSPSIPLRPLGIDITQPRVQGRRRLAPYVVAGQSVVHPLRQRHVVAAGQGMPDDAHDGRIP